MAAYIIVNVFIHNADVYESYKKLTPASISAYGGKFIVRGGNVDHLEGEWETGRIVVLEFPNAQQAREWWNSFEYSEAKEIRQKAATSQMILVEGTD
ncbi:MAG TPA: DUF1330 domain-containing protein [Saprospiraceae bacterium]|nr:DUF1330 domain-containing protein [Saprospiraceae bacterium]